jgi:hypothetical protein
MRSSNGKQGRHRLSADRRSPLVKGSGCTPVRDLFGEAAMKPYIIGAICVWFVCGITGAVMLGQQRVDVPTISGGPISLWKGLNTPIDK